MNSPLLAQSLIREKRIRFLYFLFALCGVGLTIFYVNNLLLSVILAIVFFYLLMPVVDYFQRLGLNRTLAVLVPFVLLTGVILVLTMIFLPMLSSQLVNLRAEWPRLSKGLGAMLSDFEVYLQGFVSADLAGQIRTQVQSQLGALTNDIFRELPTHVSNSLTVLFLAPFLSLFMLMDGQKWYRQVLELVPNSLFELILNLHYQISYQIGGFIRARMLETAVLSIFMWIGFEILGFPFALVLGIFGGVLNLIPYIGPVFSAVPAFAIAMIDGVDSTVYFGLAAIYILSQLLDAAVIVPFLVARIVNLHPVVVVLSVIMGAQIMGILGMIIAIPVTSVLKVTIGAIYRFTLGIREDQFSGT